MKFILVNHRTPCGPSTCIECSGSLGPGYLRDVSTQRRYCDHHCYLRYEAKSLFMPWLNPRRSGDFNELSRSTRDDHIPGHRLVVVLRHADHGVFNIPGRGCPSHARADGGGRVLGTCPKLTRGAHSELCADPNSEIEDRGTA